MAVQILGGAPIRGRPLTVDVQATCTTCGHEWPHTVYGVSENELHRYAAGKMADQWVCPSCQTATSHRYTLAAVRER